MLRVGAEREGVKILCGHHCADVDFEQSKLLVRNSEGEEWVEGDVIIAADGIKSVMREKMLSLSGLKDEGECDYLRALLKEKKLNRCSRNQVEQLEMLPTESSFLEKSLKTILNCYNWSTRRLGSDGWVLGELSFCFSQPFRPLLTEFIVRSHRGHIMAYPIKDHQVYNMVLLHPDVNNTSESWTSKGSKKQMLDFYGEWCPSTLLPRLTARLKADVQDDEYSCSETLELC